MTGCTAKVANGRKSKQSFFTAGKPRERWGNSPWDENSRTTSEGKHSSSPPCDFSSQLLKTFLQKPHFLLNRVAAPRAAGKRHRRSKSAPQSWKMTHDKRVNGRHFDGSTLSFIQFLQQNCENSTRMSSVLLGNIATRLDG